MTTSIRSNISNRNAVYIPKKIVNQLGLNEGDLIEIDVVDNAILIRIIPDPLEWALYGEKFVTVKEQEIQQICEEEQRQHENQLKEKGHPDLIDCLLYETAKSWKIPLLTMDKRLIAFVEEIGEKTEFVMSDREILKLE